MEESSAGATGSASRASSGPGSNASGGAAQLLAPGPVLSGHAGRVTCLAFSPGSTQLATGSAEGQVRLWATGDGSCQRELGGHGGLVSAVCYSPCGSLLASSSGAWPASVDTSEQHPLLLVTWCFTMHAFRDSHAREHLTFGKGQNATPAHSHHYHHTHAPLVAFTRTNGRARIVLLQATAPAKCGMQPVATVWQT